MEVSVHAIAMPKPIDRPQPQPVADQPPAIAEPQPVADPDAPALTERQRAQIAFIQQHMGSINGPKWTDDDLSREKLYD